MVALALVATYLVFEYGRISAGYDVVDAGNERAAFEEHIDTLDDEIAELKQEIAVLETHREIDREAYKQVESGLSSLQAKIQEQPQNDISRTFWSNSSTSFPMRLRNRLKSALMAQVE